LKPVKLYDVTLRDGNHAVKHQIRKEFIKEYCVIAESSDVTHIEVGHGNGLGASSLLIGQSFESDATIINEARSVLKTKKLGVHCIPGFATVRRDLAPAVENGVDTFRIASHVSEANTSAKLIEFVRVNNLEPIGVLMMSHMADLHSLVSEANKLVSYGATSVVFMDSAGNYLPQDVSERTVALVEEVPAEIGFHAHNNLGLAVANSLAAINAGATLIDGSSAGFGAGAGNSPLECISAVLNRIQNDDAKKLLPFLKMSDFVSTYFPMQVPKVSSTSISSGLSGVFSGFAQKVKNISIELGIDEYYLWEELGIRSVVAGQESIIREVALSLKTQLINNRIDGEM
jgi:4-hydroxy 2-oxovalerate aldolase